MKNRKKHEGGTVMIMFALFLLLMLGFAALGTEAGRWFLIRAELSKTVDAAALVGAKNISNPRVNPRTIANEFCIENFSNGYLGTPTGGAGTAAFDVQMIGTDKIEVDGHVSAVAILARVLGFDLIPISSTGQAQKRMVEIMLVLDRSGSMTSRNAIAELRRAASSFVDFFAATQNEDKLGLISFATSVRVDRALGTNFVTPMKASINALTANGYTNAEDGIDQADGPSGFTNTAGVQKFLIFFSDGQPTCFRGNFIQAGTTYDAVMGSDGNCQGNNNPTRNLYDPAREMVVIGTGTDPQITGDGINPCGNPARATTRWLILDTYPVPGYAPTQCQIPQGPLGDQVCSISSGLALMNGQNLKNQGVTIYTIGLGDENTAFLTQLASNANTFYSTPDATELRQIFQDVAEEIKLRLVQ